MDTDFIIIDVEVEDGDDIVIIDNLLSVEVNRTYLEQRQEYE